MDPVVVTGLVTNRSPKKGGVTLAIDFSPEEFLSRSRGEKEWIGLTLVPVGCGGVVPFEMTAKFKRCVLQLEAVKVPTGRLEDLELLMCEGVTVAVKIDRPAPGLPFDEAAGDEGGA